MSTALTDHQQEAYDAVYERLANGERYTGLRGYAGTGKTFLLARLVQQLAEEDCNVTVCAPTHKAANVLRAELGGVGVEVQTLHSFLGLRLTPDDEGGYTLFPDTDTSEYDPGVVIVDEASMVGREEWQHIEQTPRHVQWLFVGDPAQLPPVNEDPSPALDVPGPLLEEIHRQAADNPILTLATRVREGRAKGLRSQFEGGEGVAITRDADAFLDSATRAFDDAAFDEDVTTVRLLAYRNKTVRRYNRTIREALYGPDAPAFREDEWLVARDTWYHNQVPQVHNSEEVRVKKATIDTVEADDMSTWKIWKLKVRRPGQGMTRTLHVLHDDERERYEEELERRRTAAEDQPQVWEAFYELKEMFARLDYAYATTVHRAQGSTFDTVFVDYRDIAACRGPERRPLFYVAVTRPARRLAVLV